MVLALWSAVNWIYQVIRKPSELFFPVSGTLFKTPSETWDSYAPIFRRHSTKAITPELLAALAQQEGAGNPVARTYWRWSWRVRPFEIYRPASSSVGMYQMTDGTFAEAKNYCIHDHTLAQAGAWNDWQSCWLNGLYFRVIPSHAVELTAAYLDLHVAGALARHRIATASMREKEHLAAVIALYGSSVFAVMIPLKIWNNTRNEKKLEAQQLRLNEARLAALTSQINPHFLFNTLNSVSSLIRTNPDQARSVVYRLSSILRRLLQKTDNLTPLREELAFIDNYMMIEMVRFGEKLQFVKEIDPETLDRLVPSMMLQPIIENSIRHGLSSKVDGGMIRVSSTLRDGRLHLAVEDDGVGIPESRLATLFEQGIGVSNVNERLKVLFGQDYRMWIDSKLGEGTRTGIEIPDVQVAAEVAQEVPAAG